MTRRVVDDAINLEDIIDKFKDAFVKSEKKKDDKSDTKLTLGEVSLPSFWMDFRSYKRRIMGATDLLARMDDQFRKLYHATQLFGGESYLWYGGAETFKENIDSLMENYESVNDEIPNFISKLDNEEALRIEEAYHTLMESCYWSSVVNSAVAIEKRLFEILKSRNTKFMKETKSNLRFSLGELIGLYIKNKTRFKTCIPQRHDNLLTLVNDYRILSAHSKQFDLDRATADAVLNLTLKFLTDDECRRVARGRKKKS